MPDTLANALRLPVQSLARPFSPEQFSFASTLYFITFTLLCLTATVRVMDARRFSAGGAA